LERVVGKTILSAALFMVMVAFFLPYQARETAATILYEKSSFYGVIEVLEHKGLRCLSVENQAQACVMIKDGRQASLYEKLTDSLLRQSAPRQGEALWVGLGSGVAMRDLLDHFNSIDIVEIDPSIGVVAKEFFGYDDKDPRLHIYFEDGRNYIRKAAKKYDAIVIDAFLGTNLIPHLLTKESFEQMKGILSSDGVLIVNISGRPFGKGEELPKSVFKTMDAVFSYLGVVSTQNIAADPEAFDNILFLASKDRKTLSVLRTSVVEYNSANTSEGIVLADSYNPLEIIGLPIYEEMQQNYRAFLE
jgi:spermidine synthase